MNITEIHDLRTTVTSIPSNCGGVHESTLRAWNILHKVKHYLEHNVSPCIILELIAEMEDIHDILD